MRLRWLYWVAPIILMSWTRATDAGTIAANPLASGATAFITPGGTVGWRFQVHQHVEVTHLGALDRFLNGFANPAPRVGIFSDSGSLLFHTLVTSGSPFRGPSFGSPAGTSAFRYSTLGVSDSFVLSPGTYRIGADMNGNEALIRLGTPGVGGLISYLDDAAASSWNSGAGTFTFPNVLSISGNFFQIGAFGPNFEYLAPEQSASLTSGATINLGTFDGGDGPGSGGSLDITSSGETGSHVFLSSAAFSNPAFSLNTGNQSAVLTAGGVATENFTFAFDPTLLGAGLHTSDVTFHTNMGQFTYHLEATVVTPEPTSVGLLAMGMGGILVYRVKRRRRTVREP